MLVYFSEDVTVIHFLTSSDYILIMNLIQFLEHGISLFIVMFLSNLLQVSLWSSPSSISLHISITFQRHPWPQSLLLLWCSWLSFMLWNQCGEPKVSHSAVFYIIVQGDPECVSHALQVLLMQVACKNNIYVLYVCSQGWP